MSWLVLVHTLLFSLFWLTNSFAHRSVNDFLVDMVRVNVNFIQIFLLLTLALGMWSIAQILKLRRRKKHGCLFRLVGWGYLLFFYGSFGMLFYQDPVQFNRIGQIIQYFRIIFDTALLLGFALFARFLVSENTAHPTRTRLLSVFFVLFIWLLAAFSPPGSVYSTAIPEKPHLIAHRGASMLAPENTLASAKLAAGLNAFGFETDLRISQDGVLFLMHDNTLVRTTNIGEVFPWRAVEAASGFTLEDLKKLDAGSWFIAQDPFNTIAGGLVSPEQAESYRDETIPTFTEILQFVDAHDMIILYDLREPPADHPYAGMTLSISLDELQAAHLGDKAWILTGEENIAQVRRILPDATLAAGINADNPTSPLRLLASGYQVVNSEYALSAGHIRAYRQAGIWVNLWTVDEPWQYSRLWMLGADSTTSNNVHTLAAMTRPVLALPFSAHLLTWGAIGILAAAIILWSMKTGEDA